MTFLRSVNWCATRINRIRNDEIFNRRQNEGIQSPVVTTRAKNGWHKPSSIHQEKKEILVVQGTDGKLKLEQEDLLCNEVKIMTTETQFYLLHSVSYDTADNQRLNCTVKSPFKFHVRLHNSFHYTHYNVYEVMQLFVYICSLGLWSHMSQFDS